MTTPSDDFRVLVLGFSVTAEKDGYVEAANASKDSLPRPITLRKVGLGGFHPSNIPPFLDYILDKERPDAVVYEIATSSFRNQTNADINHKPILGALLNGCYTRGLPCAFLDLPRTDVDYADDWVSRVHKETFARFDLPYRLVMPEEDMFKDVVHPTPEGRDTMARTLLKLISDMISPPQHVPPAIAVKDQRSSFALSRIMSEKSGRRFERAGFEIRCAELHPGRPLKINLPEPTRLFGLLAVAGPTSGQLRLSVPDGEERTVQTYDSFCYYERMKVMTFPPLAASDVILAQLPAIPDVDLRKGDKDTGPRLAMWRCCLRRRPPQQRVGKLFNVGWPAELSR